MVIIIFKCECVALTYLIFTFTFYFKKRLEGTPLIKRLGLKLHIFRYNFVKSRRLASAKSAALCLILTKNMLILSASQFLLSYFVRINEKNYLAYLPYSRGFLSLRRTEEQPKNPNLFIKGVPMSRFFHHLFDKGIYSFRLLTAIYAGRIILLPLIISSMR